MTGLVAKIALEGAIFAFDKLYTYAVPPELYESAKKGIRVLVPFGKGNIKKQGMIFELCEEEIKGLKRLISLIDKEPVLTDEMLRLCEYMSESLFCTYYDAVHAMLPTGLGYKLINYYSANTEFSPELLQNDTEKQVYDFLYSSGEKSEEDIKKALGITADLLFSLTEKEALVKNSDTKRKIGDATEKWVRIAGEELPEVKLTPRQKEVTDLLRDVGEASVKEICYFTGVSVAVIDNLVKKGVLVYFAKQIYRAPYRAKAVKKQPKIVLTDEQQTAFSGLTEKYRSEKGEISLLYGVTGSGKTQVFLSLVDTVVSDGLGVIVMVPEIALTPQLVSIFADRYGSKIAVFHSAMSMGQRMDEWQRIKDGKALIAIGTRSAVFAPFKDLGLIIIDEEQEHTYKSEKTPRFHTRELAKFRIAYHKGLLCLASATPSLESYTNAKNGKYSLFTLKNRYGNAKLPAVETVDMRQELMNGNKSILSERLYEQVSQTLKNGKQAILLLNRRGHNTYVSCPDCGYVESCPNCSISLTYHSANNRLMCHYCGYSKKADKICPECGGEHMKFMGLGTQKAEEELKLLFPDAKILRLDADSTVTRDSYSSYLGNFAKGEYDILLGTQMVAKGLNFPNVTLVGVLGADGAMYSEDFRSFERSFSLLTQVVGRAGRGDASGNAVIQTVNPENNIIELACRQDYDSFYEQEILERKLMIWPPYCDVCVVGTTSLSRENAEKTAVMILGRIKKLLETEYKAVKLIILGPSTAAVAKVNNKYRFRMIIKCKNNVCFRKMLREAINIKTAGEVSVSVDINPETVI